MKYTDSAVRFYAYNDLVSSEHQDELMRLRHASTLIYFRVGDIANEEVMNNAHRDGITQQAIFDAVGVFYGKSGRTVRYYAETASFYTPEVRREFDMLPFSHFDLARNYGDRWRDVLEMAMLHPYFTAEKLRVIFPVDVRNPPCDSDVRFYACENSPLNGEWDMEVSPQIPVYESLSAPARRRTAYAPIIGKLVDIVSQSKRLLSESSSISPELKTEVLDHVEAMARLLPRLLGERQ